MSKLPREKQIITFQKLLANHRFLDKSQAGTGKTCPACCYTGFLVSQPIDKLIQLSRNPNTGVSLKSDSFQRVTSISRRTNGKINARAIWIQPSSLLNKNKEELLMWNQHLSADQVKIVQGTALKKKQIVNDDDTVIWLMTAEAYTAYSELMHKTYLDIVLMVCDENHNYYRGWKSKRTQVFVQNTPDYVRINFMTATPTPRGKLSAAYIYCHMIQKNYYRSYDFFLHKHAILDDYGNPTMWINHEVLEKFIDNYSIGWTAKEMYGDVEEFIIRDTVTMPEKMSEVYRSFEAMGIAELGDVVLEGKSSGTNVLRIRQILAHPHKLKLPSNWDSKGNPIAYKEVEVLKGLTPKLERILAYADEGEPLVIFATFAFEIEAIAQALIAKKLKVGVINGEVSQAKRNQVDQQFRNGELDVVVASAATAGMGFNWGFVNTVIFHSLNYGDDEFLQATARAKRGVRTQALRIVLLEYEDSADQYVMWAVHHNSKSSHSVNKDNPVIYFPKTEKEKKPNDLSKLMKDLMM